MERKKIEATISVEQFEWEDILTVSEDIINGDTSNAEKIQW